jgi:integrase
MYTKEKVIGPKYWDKRKQRCKTIQPRYTLVNEYLDVLENYVLDMRTKTRINGEPWNSNTLRKVLNERIKANENTFHAYAIEWLKGKSVKDLTVQTYSISIEKINSLYPGIDFNDINRTLKNGLYKKLIDQNYKVNYINRIFKVFKAIIKDAYIDGLHENKYFMTTGFVPGTEEVDNIYLPAAEVERIYQLWQSKTLQPHLHNVANIFLRGIYTGQRWQTYSKFIRSMIYTVGDTEMISLRQEKTTVSVSLPLSQKFKKLMEEDVHTISRQKFSDYIKEVCRLSDIKDWKRVSSHTARRTFATNMVLAGVDITKIMSITGHKTEKEFRKYVKIDNVMNAQKVVHDINEVFHS